MDHILRAGVPLHEATEVIYDAIEARIDELVALTKYDCAYVILRCGILINCDSDMGSYTEVRRFEVLDLEAGTREDHLAWFRRP